MKRLISFIVSSIMTVGVLLALMFGAALWWFNASGPLEQETTIIIDSGTGFNQIALTLEDAGAIESALLFRVMGYVKGDYREVKAGEYVLPPSISPSALMELLVKGESIVHRVTVPEGLTTREIIAMLAAETKLTGSLPVGVAEGTLMPDTYHFHRGDTRESVVTRMQESMRGTLQALWENRQPDLPIQTPEEALVLASIIEKETGVKAERKRVAGVFVNRLNRGMPLQSDPTVVYGIELEEGPMDRPLYRTDWKREHAHNTYVISGLPPTPIANPGKASIEAALNPMATDELFFVATGKGGHYFAKTLKEHNQNIARYKANLRQQAQ